MKRQFAKNTQARCLAAIELLGAIVGELENSGCDAAGQEKIKRAAGVLIGEIEVGLLSIIYENHPDLDGLGS
ncbi:MAG: hypothetical protein Q4A98_02005 [Comamonadaceae bacterium]|nr:hypothetical protein [Comamonadaceae bacterium]